MKQETYRIEDYRPEKLAELLGRVCVSAAYREAEQVLVLILEQNWDVEAIREKTALIEESLDKAVVVGTTHFDGLSQPEALPNNSTLSFIYFRERRAEVRRIPMKGKPDEEVGREPGAALQAQTDMKCTMTFFSCLPRGIGLILEIAEGYSSSAIFVGATAGVNTVFYSDGGFSRVFDCEGVYQDTLLAVLLHGADLHVRASCNFGWTSVGKTVTITKLRSPYVVQEIDGKPAADDAMTSNRSYRRGMDQAAVREQVETGRGTQFDPRFADIMLSMIDDDPNYDMREK